MTPQLFATTAENIIAVVDATLTLPSGCDINYISRFLDIPQNTAENALRMAVELGLITFNAATNTYTAQEPFAIYLLTGKDTQKAATLRIPLEKYEPYKFFKSRLEVTGSAPTAANQAKARFGLTPHRDEVKDTLISLGTYTQSLESEGAGVFRPKIFSTLHAECISLISEAADDRVQAEAIIRRMLTEEVAGWIDYREVLLPLTTAFQLINQKIDYRAVIVHAGNATESFLSQLGRHFNINLEHRNGINAKVEGFGNNLTTKHKNILKYLGHVRNGADHGVDDEINTSWNISEATSIEYTHVAISAIKSITIAITQNQYVL